MKTKARRRILLQDILKEELKDPGFRAAYEAEDLPVKVAFELSKAREAADLTQAELASRAGMLRQALTRIETKGQNLTLGTLSKLAKALDLDVEIRFTKHQPGHA